MVKDAYYSYINNDRYPNDINLSKDNIEFADYGNDESIKKLKDKYCIQALFFMKNRKIVSNFCKGAQIKNFYAESLKNKNKEASKNLTDSEMLSRRLKLDFNYLYSRPSTEHRSRVCALRDYKRNNQALILLEEIGQ